MADREWQIEMLWRCSTCPPKTENRGRDKSCKNCGAPKKESDKFYMPGDTRHEARVTDRDQLDDAHAGPDWSCRYCNSAQRRNDGECARCGVPQEQGVAKGHPAPPSTESEGNSHTAGTRESHRPRRQTRKIPKHVLVVLAVVAVAAVAVVLYFLLRTKEVDAVVTAVHWSHQVDVEKYQVVSDDGFSPPGDAFETVSNGTRWHHDDKVPDGTHTEKYTVQVACGQTCRPIAKSCSTSCSDNKNGYSTCKETCTGGGESCSTKYCNEQRTKTVQDYKNVPVYRPYYSWKAWRWRPNRTLNTSGDSLETNWPDASPSIPLLPGEQERSTTHPSYSVTFSKGKDSWDYSPDNLNEFEKFKKGQSFHLKVSLVSVQVL